MAPGKRDPQMFLVRMFQYVVTAADMVHHEAAGSCRLGQQHTDFFFHRHPIRRDRQMVPAQALPVSENRVLYHGAGFFQRVAR